MYANKISQVKSLIPDGLKDQEDNVRNFEARMIAQSISGLDYSQLILDVSEFDEGQIKEIRQIYNQRETGMPLAYILNYWSFRELELFIDERVLIPRSETELVVEEVLNLISDIESPKVIDVGTGSGAIALSVATENQDSEVIGVDISQKAIEVANINRSLLKAESVNVKFIQSDLFVGLEEEKLMSFDLIVSNPPYIGHDEELEVEKSVVDFEPHIALFADDSGFEIYRKLIHQAFDWLNKNGSLVLEIAPRHSSAIINEGYAQGYSSIEIKKDFNSRDRIAILKK